MAHSKLLNYFDEMMQYVDEKQRIQLGWHEYDFICNDNVNNKDYD